MLCCMDPLECERAEHHSEKIEPLEVSCLKGYFECSSELGGGCCPEGYECSSNECYYLSLSRDNLNFSGGMPQRPPSTPSDGSILNPLCDIDVSIPG
jgi:hypothetical protein